MKKSLKIKAIFVMAFVMCFSLAFCLAFTSGNAAKVSATKPATFEMLGMSIRYSAADGDDGIRFGVKLDLETYNALKSDNNARAGILVTPTDQIIGDSLSLSTAVASNARYGILYKGGDGGYDYWTVSGEYATGIVYLHGFPEASYNRPITAVAYIDWDNDGMEMNHSDTVKISMADVALAVTTDYAASNTYGTTAEQAEKLDDYLLNYDVKFVDNYGGTVETQSVKYGSSFEEPEAAASRYGYTFTDEWFEKNGASSFESTPTNFSDKTVKYARTFKAGYDVDGPAYEKPVLDTSSPVYEEGAWSWVYQNKDKIQMKGSAYLFDGVTIPYGDYYNDAPDTEYAVTATFHPTAEGVGKVYPKVGFTFSGAEDHHLEIAYDAFNDRIKVYQKGEGTKYRNYENESGIEPYREGEDIDEDARVTLTVVYRNPKFFYVYINGVYACEINLRYDYHSGNFGYGESTERHCATIGTGSALKVGLSVDNGYAEFYDYGYRIFDTYENPITLQAGATIDSFCCDLSNSTNFPASGTGQNPQFEVTATAPNNPLIKYAYFSLSAAEGHALLIGYNTATSRVRVQIGTLYREYTITSEKNGYNAETANVFKLTYDGSVTFRLFINGKEALLSDGFPDGTSGTINMRYGMDGNNSSGVSGTKAWHGFAGSSAGTSGKTLGVGFSYTATADEYVFAYSTDGEYTVASNAHLAFPQKVANFKSNVTNGDYNFDANPANSGDNPSFVVSATLDAAHADGDDFVGFTFSAIGKVLKVGYNKNKDSNRVRVQVGSKYREYTIKTDGGYSNGYNRSSANTFKLVYNGGAAMQLYINGQEAYLTNGFNNCICLRYGMSGDDSSGDNSVLAWHGFAGSDEAQGTERTLYIGTFGDGMTLNDHLEVASFKSNVSSSGNFPAAGTGSNNPTFDVTAILDSAHATGTDFVGFNLATKGYGLQVGYNKAENRVRVQVGSKYREYTIAVDQNGYNSSGANTFRLTYNGGATLRLYINGKEALLSNGFPEGNEGTINLRFGMNGDNSSDDDSVQAWHGFAGSGESEGKERTLYIETFGDGMTGLAFTE